MEISADYTIRLDAFQGPLDLLLYLIRRAEVDVFDIPIAEITDQYLAFLKNLDRIDMDAAGEFLVMAATLMEIKSRMLAPLSNEASTESDSTDGSSPSSSMDSVAGLDEADPRYELVMQLLAYKQYRDAANELQDRREEWLHRFPVRAGVASVPSSEDDRESDAGADEIDPATIAADLEDVSLWDLARLFQQIVSAVDFARLGDHKIEYDDTPIELHQEDLMDQLSRSDDGSISFRALMSGRTRVEAIGLFLATLELVRQCRVSLKQDRPNEDILLERRIDGNDPASTDATDTLEPNAELHESSSANDSAPGACVDPSSPH